MASRYPLIVNKSIPRLEELRGVDDLNLSQSLIELANGLPTTSNQIMRYDGADLSWVSGNSFVLNVVPDIVRTDESQALTNKTIDATLNTIENIPNSALVNDYITFGTQQVFLGDTVAAIDTDTRYEINGSGAGVNSVDLKLDVYDLENNTATNPTPNGNTAVKLTVAGDLTLGYDSGTKTITITSTFVDTNTTYSASATGGLSTLGTAFSLKNSATLINNRVLKWDDTNNQLVNTNLTESATDLTSTLNFTAATVKSTGNTIVGVGTGATTLQLRSGTNVTRQRPTIQAVMSTDGSGVVTSSASLFYDHVTGGGNQSSWNITDEDGVTGPVAHIQATAVPASATSAGRPGQVRFDATHIYFCTAENTWIRALRDTF